MEEVRTKRRRADKEAEDVYVRLDVRETDRRQ
jgi:hypothetical protein